MSIEAVSWAFGVKVGSATQKLVLVCLAEFANQHGDAWPSIATICDRTEFADKPVRRALAALERLGLVVIDRRNGAGSRYKINVGATANITSSPVSATAVPATEVRKTAVPQTQTPVSATGTAVSATNRTVNNHKEPIASPSPRYPVYEMEDGHPVVGGYYLDVVFQKILDILDIGDLSVNQDMRPVARWLSDGIVPEQIYAAIRERSRRSMPPFSSLAYFDQPVRAAAGKARVA